MIVISLSNNMSLVSLQAAGTERSVGLHQEQQFTESFEQERSFGGWLSERLVWERQSHHSRGTSRHMTCNVWIIECKSLTAQTDVAALFTGDEVSVSTHSQSPTCNQISYMFVVVTSVGVMSLSNIEILSHNKTSVAEPSCILPNFLSRNIFSYICFFHNVWSLHLLVYMYVSCL